MRMAIAVAAGMACMGAAQAQDDYRSVLMSCVRHVRCDSEECRSGSPCDVTVLNGSDRAFFEERANEVAGARETPGRIADELIASRAAPVTGTRRDGEPGRGRREGEPGCPPRGCDVAQPRSVPQTALPAQRIGRE